MKHLEKRIIQLGFNVLQEKEDLIYFEKTFFNMKNDDHKVFVIYDRKENKIKSIDPYRFTDENMELVPQHGYWNLFKKKKRTS